MQNYSDAEKKTFAELLVREWREPLFNQCRAVGIERQDLWRVFDITKVADLHRKHRDGLVAQSNMDWINKFWGNDKEYVKIHRRVGNGAHPDYHAPDGVSMLIRAFEKTGVFSAIFMRFVDGMMRLGDGSGAIDEADVNERRQTLEMKQLHLQIKSERAALVSMDMLSAHIELRVWEWLTQSGIGTKHPDGLRRWGRSDLWLALSALNAIDDIECTFRCGVAAGRAKRNIPSDADILKCREKLFKITFGDPLPGWRLRREKTPPWETRQENRVWLDVCVGVRWVPIKDVTELVDAARPAEEVPEGDAVAGQPHGAPARRART